MRDITATCRGSRFAAWTAVLLGVIALGGIGLLAGCSRPVSPGVESPPEPQEQAVDSRGFDPLELSQDREVIPALYPRTGAIRGRQVLVEAESMTSDVADSVYDSTVIAPIPEATLDSLSGQAYRVQLYTTKLYGDAKSAVRVAEEIFDRPVYLDYEVPYFKVRVGAFASRDDAERYQQKAKAAGYSDAWVVMVNLVVKEAAPLYDDLGGFLDGSADTEAPDISTPPDSSMADDVER